MAAFGGGPGSIFGYFFRDHWKKWLKCKNEQHSITFGGVLGVGASSGGSWRLPWEGFGRYVGRLWLQDGVFLAISGDVWTSWRQGWRTRAQDAAAERKSLIFGGLEGVGDDASLAVNLWSPPLRNSKGTAGAPPGGFSYQLKKLRLRLSTDRVTQHVPFGTVADRKALKNAEVKEFSFHTIRAHHKVILSS